MSKYLKFQEAFDYIKKYNLHTRRQWNEWSKNVKPNYIPSCPQNIYKNEWISWDHWLQKNSYKRRSKIFLDFEECVDYIKNENISTKKQWNEWSKEERPDNIPATPNIIFKEKWISWPHWLSSNIISNKQKKELQFYTYNQCIKIIHNLNLKSLKDWHKWSKKNTNDKIPSNPDKTYKSEWISWLNFLGIGDKIEYYTFDDAVNIARKSGCKTISEWNKHSKNFNKIPSNVHRHYKKQWKGYSYFLGINIVATQNRKYKSFLECKKYIQKIKWNSTWDELLKFVNLPTDIPKSPHHVYKEYWINYSDFLGQVTKVVSKGENRIKLYLDSKNINYTQQKTFDECISINKLKFDFYLLDLNICIEYDGIQHFEPIEYFGGKIAFKKQIERDNFKNKWCFNNNIMLIRISYLDDIEKLLNNKLIYR